MTLIKKLKLIYNILFNNLTNNGYIDYIIELDSLLIVAKNNNSFLLDQITALDKLVGVEKQELQKTINLYETQYIRNNVWSKE